MDVTCYYADFGRPYAGLMRRMTASAKAFVPDCRTVLLTPTPGCEGSAYFDLVLETPAIPRTPDNVALLSRERCRANVSWLAGTSEMTICCDPDIEFTRPPILGGDIGLIWRDKPDQRVNAALFWSRPGQHAFWRRYGQIVLSMPEELHSWWSDQMAFTLMLGSYREVGNTPLLDGSIVRLMGPDDVALPETQTSLTWAIHYKGKRKGEGWDQWFGTEPAHAAA